jgi:glycosyltransferase involved in cell wall biosynthesis
MAVSWAPYSRRSEMFARELGGAHHCVHNLRFQSPWHAPIKYPIMAVRTLRRLFRERPAAVHVQNPPFLCGLVVDLYCRLSGAKFVIEYHSAAFGKAWDWALPIQKRVARRAAVNIVTNEHWAGVVQSWRAHTLVMYDPLLELPAGERFPVVAGPRVAYLGTFAEDEPIDAVLRAASLLPEVHFYVTGDKRKAPASLLAGASPNVTFTGFLDPNGEYLGLLRGVDAVIALTTRDHTLQLAGCEAIAVGQPLVTSDFAYLRELFGAGTVFVANTAESIRDGVADVIARRDELAAAIDPFRSARRLEWKVRMAELEAVLPRQPISDVGGAAVTPIT